MISFIYLMLLLTIFVILILGIYYEFGNSVSDISDNSSKLLDESSELLDDSLDISDKSSNISGNIFPREKSQNYVSITIKNLNRSLLGKIISDTNLIRIRYKYYELRDHPASYIINGLKKVQSGLANVMENNNFHNYSLDFSSDFTIVDWNHQPITISGWIKIELILYPGSSEPYSHPYNYQTAYMCR